MILNLYTRESEDPRLYYPSTRPHQEYLSAYITQTDIPNPITADYIGIGHYL